VRRLQVAALGGPGDVLPLPPGDVHHLRVVLRMRAGAPLVVFADGSEADAELTDGDGVRITSASRTIGRPVPLHLVFGVPKGAPLDNLLRMAVEVGATQLHPALTERTVPRGDHLDRWTRIVSGAAEQCGRADVPVVHPLRPLRMITASLAEVDRRVAVPGAPASAAPSGPAALLIGPEGGLSASELERVLAEGWTPVGLGPHVLRVDTAAAVGLALLRSAGTTAAPDRVGPA
jgi:16S rRNA (uracil1498-N3)-methyltransferase